MNSIDLSSVLSLKSYYKKILTENTEFWGEEFHKALL